MGSLKMPPDLSGPTKSNISMIFGAVLGIVSSITCFGFIFKKLKINHVIKKLLLVVTVQQLLGYAISLVPILAIAHGIVNKLTCFVSILSIVATLLGTQALLSMISIIRYFLSFYSPLVCHPM